jgi:hypothetical protein
MIPGQGGTRKADPHDSGFDCIAGKTARRYDGAKEIAMIELTELWTLDEYDPDDGVVYINEIMAADDANDPYLESYQQYSTLQKPVPGRPISLT